MDAVWNENEQDSTLPDPGPTQIQYLTLECGDVVTLASEAGNPFADMTIGEGEAKVTVTLTGRDFWRLFVAYLRRQRR